MRRPLLLSAFTMNTPTHLAYGMWRSPETRATEYDRLDAWVALARLLDRGGFDLMFFADIVGLPNDYRGGWDTFVREGLQIPNHDPAVILSALARETEHLGFAITSSVLQEHPFSFARKMSTLDHVTGGRVAWNIVTTAMENAARNFDLPGRVEHDERYAWAREYVDVAYKLWEGSWEDDALLVDRERGVYADPAKIHKIHHAGKRYRVEGPHLTAPSPQRTPVLFQAGASEAGREFAARHAEGVFIIAASPEGARKAIDDVRGRAVRLGRRADDLVFLQELACVTGSTEAEARARARALDEHHSSEGVLAHRSGGTGIDLAGLDPDTPIRELARRDVQGSRSVLSAMLDAAPPGAEPTLADLVRQQQEVTRVVGTPEQIADEIERWHDAGVDGINLRYITTPGSFEEFVDHVVPELRRRGLLRAERTPGTLREKLLGRGPRLPDTHPARRYRRAPRPT